MKRFVCVAVATAAVAAPDGEKCLKREIYYYFTVVAFHCFYAISNTVFDGHEGGGGRQKGLKNLKNLSPRPPPVRKVRVGITLTDVFPSFSRRAHPSKKVFVFFFFHLFIITIIYCPPHSLTTVNLFHLFKISTSKKPYSIWHALRSSRHCIIIITATLCINAK